MQSCVGFRKFDVAKVIVHLFRVSEYDNFLYSSLTKFLDNFELRKDILYGIFFFKKYIGQGNRKYKFHKYNPPYKQLII